MRFDRLTAKLQEALADAQSLAIGHDNTAIEPGHLLSALLEQQGGSVRPLLAQAGADLGMLGRELARHLDNLPRLSQPTGEVAVGQKLAVSFRAKIASDLETGSVANQAVLHGVGKKIKEANPANNGKDWLSDGDPDTVGPQQTVVTIKECQTDADCGDVLKPHCNTTTSVCEPSSRTPFVMLMLPLSSRTRV